MRGDERLGDTSVAEQCGFDIAGFDTVTAHLQLLINAPEEFDDAVGADPSAIAGAVHARTTSDERIGQETFGGKRGFSMVSPSHTGAADNDFPRDPLRDAL